MKNENTQMNDPVNHPAHYTSGKIEVIDFLEDQKFPFHLANAVKYISRAGKKDPEKTVQDLEKAVWYINRYIGLLQKAQNGEGLKEQPEIVRCKDCKHSCGRGLGMYCQFIECEKTGAFHKEDWFCADCERKEDR